MDSDLGEVLVPPDVEDLITRWLPGALAAHGRPGVPVSVAIPDPRPPVFVVCPQIGGPPRTAGVIDGADIGFECWASTDGDAKRLALLVRALVLALPGHQLAGVFVYTVGEFAAAPALLPDPASRQSRYVWTATITVRAATI